MSFQDMKPRDWPQDKLAIPGSIHAPPVDKGNRLVVEREAFTMTGSVVLLGPTVYPQGTQITQVLPTDQDGDFWCQQIYIQNPYASNELLFNMSLQIGDIRTGQSLTYGAPNGVPLQFLDQNGIFTNSKAGAPAGVTYPNGFRSTGLIQQPYCFTRQGGIQLIWTLNSTKFSGSRVEVDIAFGGWKEYANASG